MMKIEARRDMGDADVREARGRRAPWCHELDDWLDA
jgi:hypothetical protein